MKKILSLLALLLIAGGLTSCSLDAVFKKTDPTNLTGVLVEQTSNDQYTGSHLLMDDLGKVLAPLRSLSINLSSSKYLDNKVEVIGEMNAKDGVFEVSGISVLEVITKDNSKREFVEYKNTDLGLRLKYYNDWKLSEIGNIITFTAPADNTNQDVDKVVITQSPFNYTPPAVSDVPDTNVAPVVNTEDVSHDALKAYATENLKSESNIDILFRKVGVDKLNALKVDGSGNSVDYFLYRDGFIYQISFIAATVVPVEENKNIFNEMLSEFQFLGFTVQDDGNTPDTTETTTSTDATAATDTTPAEPSSQPDTQPAVDTTGMDSFQSALYHFSAAYPKNWYYAGVKGTSPDVLHHYGFSNKSLDEGNEIIGLDILATNKPDGESASGDVFSVYITKDSRTYKISGPKEYADAIRTMAKSITKVKDEIPTVN